jgi:hypothetical protein
MSEQHTNGRPVAGAALVSRLNTNRPHSARVWNYFLGGKDHFAADRQLGEQIRAAYPQIVQVAQVSRAFLRRVVTFLAGEAGIRQFLDIGTGLPTADKKNPLSGQAGPQTSFQRARRAW